MLEILLKKDEWMDEGRPEYNELSTESSWQGKKAGVKWIKGSGK